MNDTEKDPEKNGGKAPSKQKINKKSYIILLLVFVSVIAVSITAYVMLKHSDTSYEMNVIDEETGEYLLVGVPTNFSMEISLDEESSQKSETPTVFDIYSKGIETNNKINGNILTIEAPKGGYEKGEAYTIDITGYGSFTDEQLSKAKKLLFVIKEKNTSYIEYKKDVKEIPASSIQVEGEKITINGRYDSGQIILADSDGDGIEEIYKLTNTSNKGDRTEAEYTDPEADEVYEDIDIFYYDTVDPKELEIDEEEFKGELETSGILEVFCAKAYADSDIKFKVDKKADGTYCDFTIKLSDPADEDRQLIFKAKVANKILYKNKNGLILMNNSVSLQDGIEISVKGENKEDTENEIKQAIENYKGGIQEPEKPGEFKIPLLPIKIAIIGPVYAKFDIGVKGEIKVGGKFNLGTDFTSTLSAGVVYDYKTNKIIKKYTGIDAGLNAYIIVKGKLEAFAGGYAEVGVVVPLLVTVEVDPELGSYFEAAGCAVVNNIPKKPNLDGYYSIELGAKIYADLKIELLGKFTNKINIIDSKRPIWKKSNKLQFKSLDIPDSYTIEDGTIDIGDVVVTYYDVVEGKDEESNLAEYELYIDGDAKEVTEGKISYDGDAGEHNFKFVWEKDSITFEQSMKVSLIEWQDISTDSLSRYIQGGVTADQLQRFLERFPEPADSETIVDTFLGDAYHIILNICESEETIQGENIYYTYVYNLGSVNAVLSGLVDYRMDANTSYSEFLYTDDNNLYITLPPTDWMMDYVMDNLRATSNGKVLIVYYDVNEIDYSTPSSTSFRKTLRAVFEKQSSGLYKLRRIENN